MCLFAAAQQFSGGMFRQLFTGMLRGGLYKALEPGSLRTSGRFPALRGGGLFWYYGSVLMPCLGAGFPGAFQFRRRAVHCKIKQYVFKPCFCYVRNPLSRAFCVHDSGGGAYHIQYFLLPACLGSVNFLCLKSNHSK